MSRGNRPSPGRGPGGVSHHDSAAEKVVEIVPQDHSAELAAQIAAQLPDGQPREVFMRSVQELGDRLRDTDLEALRRMAWALYVATEAEADVRANGIFDYHEIFGKRPNPALKIARDETNLYLKIADQYALTFVSRLRAGILQLAGQSMLQQIHENMAAAIVSRIVSSDVLEQRAIEGAVIGRPAAHVCGECDRSFASTRGLAIHRSATHGKKRKKKPKR